MIKLGYCRTETFAQGDSGLNLKERREQKQCAGRMATPKRSSQWRSWMTFPCPLSSDSYPAERRGQAYGRVVCTHIGESREERTSDHRGREAASRAGVEGAVCDSERTHADSANLLQHAVSEICLPFDGCCGLGSHGHRNDPSATARARHSKLPALEHRKLTRAAPRRPSCQVTAPIMQRHMRRKRPPGG